MKVVEGKVVVLGSQGVGKTSLVVRYIGKMFYNRIPPTIGASFFTCKINFGDTGVKLQVWDTAGQERFRSMTPMYYRNANAALLVFDITSLHSYNAVKSWVKELQSNIADPMVLSLIGNKNDLTEERKITIEEANLYAASIGGQYYETSALHDQGIEQVFKSTAAELLKLSTNAHISTLRMYDSIDGEYDPLPTGNPSAGSASNIGNEEVPPWSRSSIAHGEVQKSYLCC